MHLKQINVSEAKPKKVFSSLSHCLKQSQFFDIFYAWMSHPAMQRHLESCAWSLAFFSKCQQLFLRDNFNFPNRVEKMNPLSTWYDKIFGVNVLHSSLQKNTCFEGLMFSKGLPCSKRCLMCIDGCLTFDIFKLLGKLSPLLSLWGADKNALLCNLAVRQEGKMSTF